MWFRLHWAMGGNFLIACAMAPLLLSTCNIHWLARPHVLGWLLLLGVVWWCERRGPLWILGGPDGGLGECPRQFLSGRGGCAVCAAQVVAGGHAA